MYANYPKMAKKWEKHTPKGKKLPEKIKKKRKKNESIELIASMITEDPDVSKTVPLYIDIDETLIHTDIKGPGKKFSYRNKDFFTRSRPGASKFIDKLREIPEILSINGMTFNDTEFQKKALDAVSLAEKFDNIYGIDEYNKITKSKDGILIDDVHNEVAIKIKLINIGIEENRLIKISKWTGDQKDRVLELIINKVEGLL